MPIFRIRLKIAHELVMDCQYVFALGDRRFSSSLSIPEVVCSLRLGSLSFNEQFPCIESMFA